MSVRPVCGYQLVSVKRDIKMADCCFWRRTWSSNENNQNNWSFSGNLPLNCQAWPLNPSWLTGWQLWCATTYVNISCRVTLSTILTHQSLKMPSHGSWAPTLPLPSKDLVILWQFQSRVNCGQYLCPTWLPEEELAYKHEWVDWSPCAGPAHHHPREDGLVRCGTDPWAHTQWTVPFKEKMKLN